MVFLRVVDLLAPDEVRPLCRQGGGRRGDGLKVPAFVVRGACDGLAGRQNPRGEIPLFWGLLVLTHTPCALYHALIGRQEGRQFLGPQHLRGATQVAGVDHVVPIVHRRRLVPHEPHGDRAGNPGRPHPLLCRWPEVAHPHV